MAKILSIEIANGAIRPPKRCVEEWIETNLVTKRADLPNSSIGSTVELGSASPRRRQRRLSETEACPVPACPAPALPPAPPRPAPALPCPAPCPAPAPDGLHASSTPAPFADEIMSDEIPDNDELTAEVTSLLFAGRHPRIEGLVLEMQPPPVVDAFMAARETIAALGLRFPPEAPSGALRDRLMATLSAKQKRPRTALLVLDMLVDHLTPGGALEVPRARLIVPALLARIEAARKEGVPVVYVVDEHTADDPDLAMWGSHNVEGTGGNDVWPELAPQAGDRVVKKPTYSAFFESHLEAVLDELRVDSLVLTGCLTEIGIKATATDALQKGFSIEVPPDAQAGAAEGLEQGALASMRMMAPYGRARKARLERLAVL